MPKFITNLRIDILSFAGFALAVGAIFIGNSLEGGHINSLINGPATIIVVGGTLGAILLQTPMHVFIFAMKSIIRVFIPPANDFKETLQTIISLSNIARREGLLGLEKFIDSASDTYLKKGIQLLVDGSEPEVIRSVLEVEIDMREHKDLQAAKVFEGMGGYSPTIGILGAVMGLIHVMENLTDPSKLGAGIATAFVATIYGVGAANLILLPFANKLKSHAHRDLQHREMIVEGLVSIAEGENPRNIEAKLQGYVS